MNVKELDFHTYCKKCKYSNLAEEMEPCRECLQNPMALGSKKPLRFFPGNQKRQKRADKTQCNMK